MVEKEGTEGEADARKAYQAAHEDRERSAPEAKVSAALVDRVMIFVIFILNRLEH